jgi:transposase
MTIVETRAVTGGVDTHADMHVAAALDPIGGLLGVEEFPVTPAGYARLLGWLGGFGTVALVGIEGTGSYGAGLARHVTAAGIRVVEVDRSDRQDRRRQGKSDPLDAVSAARAAQPGRARGAPKGRDGAVEAIRALMVAKRSARSERVQTNGQARALVLTGPDDLRKAELHRPARGRRLAPGRARRPVGHDDQEKRTRPGPDPGHHRRQEAPRTDGRGRTPGADGDGPALFKCRGRDGSQRSDASYTARRGPRSCGTQRRRARRYSEGPSRTAEQEPQPGTGVGTVGSR